MDIIKRKQV